MTTPTACDQASQWLSDELAGTLSPDDAKALEAHLETCGSCQELAVALLREDRALRELAARGRSKELARWIHSALRRRPARPAWVLWVGGSLAAAGLVVATVLVAHLTSVPPPAKSEARAPEVEDRGKAAAEAARRAEVVRRAQEEKARADADRRRSELRLAEIERELQRIAEARARAETLQQEEEKRRVAEEFARKEAERRDAEAAREKARVEQLKADEQILQAKRPPPPAIPAGETRSAWATLEHAEGEVFAVGPAGRPRLQAGALLTAGVETGGPGSWAVVRLPDGTSIEMAAESSLKSGGAARIVLSKGTVTASVKKQPEGAALVLATPHAEAKVLGTTLRLVVDPTGKGSTRLDVKEGKVQLKRLSDGKVVDVVSGHQAVAATGVDLVAKRSARVPGDMEVPAGGWATLKPNPELAAMPDNSWKLLTTKFVPRGAVSFDEFRFGLDPAWKLGHPKEAASLVYDEARNVTVFFGGYGGAGTNQTLLLSVSDATWYQAQADHFDFIRDDVRHATDRPSAQGEYGACYDPFEKVYVKGIGPSRGSPSDEKVWSYDPAKNRWEALAGWETGPAYAGTGTLGASRMVYDRAHGVAVVFGGLPLENRETWFFDVRGRKWRKGNAGSAAPPGRYHAHMVYDEKSRKTVLFGGLGNYENQVALDDTWIFDGGTRAWTEMRPKSRPPARWMGAMSYDAANGVCVLVGGSAGGPEQRALLDTWIYDLARNEWREMKPAGQPPAGSLGQSAYDRVNNVTVTVAADGETYVYRFKGKKQ